MKLWDGTPSLENRLAVSTKAEYLYSLWSCTSRYIPNRNMSEFTKRCAHNSSIHNTPNWVLAKCPSIIKWINQLQYVPKLKYYIAVKTNTFQKEEKLLQRERNQKWNNSYCMIPFVHNSKNSSNISMLVKVRIWVILRVKAGVRGLLWAWWCSVWGDVDYLGAFSLWKFTELCS